MMGFALAKAGAQNRSNADGAGEFRPRITIPMAATATTRTAATIHRGRNLSLPGF